MSTPAAGSHRNGKIRRRWRRCVRCGWASGLFGVPITHILEIVGATRPQPVPLAPAYVGGLVHYRGDVLTTVSLRQLLDLPARDGPQDMLVLEGAGGCLACWLTRSAKC